MNKKNKILAIDTSSVSGSIALVCDGSVAGELTVGNVGKHSIWLLGAVDEFLKDNGLKVSDIDLFAVGSGPGSFTGLRIGISTVKGLAWSLGRPVIGISTLEALALNVNEEDALICPILDARKKQVYSALFSRKGACLERLTGDRAYDPDELVKTLKGSGYAAKGSLPLTFLGHGLDVYREFISSEIDGCTFASEEDWEVSAASIGLIAHGSMSLATSALELLPTYRRASEAEFKKDLSK
jgi:tRNA threonylcarbamoyladenosine biosynthesis protein TsaB